MTEADLITQLTRELKDLASDLVTADYESAIDMAEREIGVVVSGATTDAQLNWMVRRSKRHLFYILATGNAYKFRFEGIFLQHKFDHLMRLVEFEDKEWKEALASLAAELAGAEAYEFFGTHVDPGFRYERLTGKDLTYGSDNVVVHKPDENS